MKITLKAIAGPLIGQDFIIKGSGIFMVGRSADAEVCLQGDACVSRKHFILDVADDEIRIRDAESLNGILVNGIRFGGSRGSANPNLRDEMPSLRVDDGDRVQVGDTLLEITTDRPVFDPITGTCRNRSSHVPTSSKDASPSTISTLKRRSKPAEVMEENTRRLDFPAIPGYDIIRLIGSGKNGKIYLARNRKTEELVAAKTIKAKPGATDHTKRRFEREIQAYQALRHPNIVAFYGHGYTGHSIYLLLEYIPGQSLEHLLKIRDRKIPAMEAIPIMLGAAAGMAYAHEKGYVHRDLKPVNILLTGEYGKWDVKIADLGLSKCFAGMGATDLSSSGDIGGSYGYMPREQLIDFKNTLPVSDVFALGATFYNVLTGFLVYDLENITSPLEMVLEGNIIPIERREPDIDPDLATVINRAIHPEHEKRFQTAGEFKAALEPVLLRIKDTQ